MNLVSRFTVGKSDKSFAISTSIGKHCICDQNHESGKDVLRFVMTTDVYHTLFFLFMGKEEECMIHIRGDDPELATWLWFYVEHHCHWQLDEIPFLGSPRVQSSA